jgi:hypothetical protein
VRLETGGDVRLGSLTVGMSSAAWVEVESCVAGDEVDGVEYAAFTSVSPRRRLIEARSVRLGAPGSCVAGA